MTDVVTPQDIEQLKTIWREEQHEELSDAEALEIGHRLLRAVDAVTRPSGSAPLYHAPVRTPSRLPPPPSSS